MSDSERVQHLKEVRAELVEKRIYLIGEIGERVSSPLLEKFVLHQTQLANNERTIEIIDKAITEEEERDPSRYATSGLRII